MTDASDRKKFHSLGGRKQVPPKPQAERVAVSGLAQEAPRAKPSPLKSGQRGRGGAVASYAAFRVWTK